MLANNIKSLRFTQKEIDKIQDLADKEHLKFSQFVMKLVSIGMKEYEKNLDKNIHKTEVAPEKNSQTERRKTHLIIQNTLMLELLINKTFGEKDKKALQLVRRNALNILNDDFMGTA